MAQPYIGEIRVFAGNFAPVGWSFCEGQLVAISDNDALFSLIGTTYGGDGQSTFALPDLRGRIPLHVGTGFSIGQASGAEAVTLTTPQIPAHQHAMLGSTANATTTSPTNNAPATMAEVTTFAYGTDLPPTTLQPQSLGSAGGNQPHSNFQPYVCINYIISLFGIFPTQS